MKKVLSKEQFTEYINHIINLYENSKTLEKALQIFCNDRDFTGFFYSLEFELKFLKNLIDDENDWIEWWIYEGRENPKENAIDCNGKKWTIDSPETLYDFLFQENAEEKNPYYEGGMLCIDTINRMIIQSKNTIEKREKEGKSTESLDGYVALLKMAKSMMINDLAIIGNLYLIENEDK